MSQNDCSICISNKERRKNTRLFDNIINALAYDAPSHQSDVKWSCRTPKDVMAAFDNQLQLKPPHAHIIRDVIHSETRNLQDLPKGFVEQMQNAVAYPFQEDKGVAMLPRETSEFFFDLFTHYKQTFPDKVAGVVEVDISNMRNTNDAIGRGNVTKAVSIINRIYTMALTDPNALLFHKPTLAFLNNLALLDEIKTGSNRGEVIPVRKGGDELRYYVSGLEQNVIKERLKLASSAVQALTTELGTDALEHTKYKDDEHPQWHAGFGAGAGVIMFTPERMHMINDVQEPLNAAIDADKLAQGKANGLNQQDLKPAIQIRQETDLEAVIKTLDKYRFDLGINSDAPNTGLPRMLYYPLPEGGDAYAFNNHHAKNAFESGYGDLFAQVVEASVNLRDPITQLRTSCASLEALDQIKMIQPKPGHHRPFMLEIEMENLQGLNKEITHEAADVLIREFAELVRAEITETLGVTRSSSDASFYSARASRVRILIKDHQMDDIMHALAHINTRILAEFNPRPLTEGSEKTIGEIMHPKDVSLGDMRDQRDEKLGIRKGLGINFAALETHPDMSAGAMVDVSDKLLEVFTITSGDTVMPNIKHIDDNTLWMKGSTAANKELKCELSRNFTMCLD